MFFTANKFLTEVSQGTKGCLDTVVSSTVVVSERNFLYEFETLEFP